MSFFSKNGIKKCWGEGERGGESAWFGGVKNLKNSVEIHRKGLIYGKFGVN